jgi:protein ATS1
MAFEASTCVLVAAGSNAHGQLGIGSYDDACSSARVLFHPATPHIVSLAAGANHTLVLTDDGSLLVAGRDRCNDLARLTAAADETYFQPTDLAQLPAEIFATIADHQLVGVACAWETSFLHFRHIGGTDRLVAFGANDFGERGAGEGTPASWANVIDLAGDGGPYALHELVAGPRHVLARWSRPGEANGRVAGWGAARKGQLGSQVDSSGAHGFPHPAREPTQLTGHASRCLFRPSPIVFAPADTDAIVSMCAGKDHSAFLLRDGREVTLPTSHVMNPPSRPYVQTSTWRDLFTLEHDGEGSIVAVRSMSSPTQTSFRLAGIRITSLVCGSEHAIAIADDGTHYLYGWNEHGNLGVGHTDAVAAWTRGAPPLEGYRIERAFAGNATTWLLCSRQGRDAAGLDAQ